MINAHPNKPGFIVDKDRYTLYGISSLSLFSCWSATSEMYDEIALKKMAIKNWRSNVARAGIFHGYIGEEKLITAHKNTVKVEGLNYGR